MESCNSHKEVESFLILSQEKKYENIIIIYILLFNYNLCMYVVVVYTTIVITIRDIRSCSLERISINSLIGLTDFMMQPSYADQLNFSKTTARDPFI